LESQRSDHEAETHPAFSVDPLLDVSQRELKFFAGKEDFLPDDRDAQSSRQERRLRSIIVVVFFVVAFVTVVVFFVVVEEASIEAPFVDCLVAIELGFRFLI